MNLGKFSGWWWYSNYTHVSLFNKSLAINKYRVPLWVKDYYDIWNPLNVLIPYRLFTTTPTRPQHGTMALHSHQLFIALHSRKIPYSPTCQDFRHPSSLIWYYHRIQQALDFSLITINNYNSDLTFKSTIPYRDYIRILITSLGKITTWHANPQVLYMHA